MKDRLQFHAARDMFLVGEEITIKGCVRHPGGKIGVLKDLKIEMIDPEEHVSPIDPFIRMSPDEATVLMDELWRLGIRPSDGSGSTGQLSATERHLEDMRRLVFEKPNP